MQSLPTITRNLLLINVLALLANGVFGMFMASQGKDLNSYLGLYYIGSPDFQIYQLVTYMFMHGGWIHLIFNMFALWMFGGIIERMWGPKKFLFYYLACGIGAGLTQEAVQFLGFASPLSSTVGASGAVFGILLAFGMLFPNERLFIIPIPFPIKAKWLVIGYGALELVQAFGYNDGVAHFAHLGGMIFGLLLILYWRRNNGGGYGYDGNAAEKLKRWFTDKFDRFSAPKRPKMRVHMGGRRKDDYEYNARKKADEDAINAILEKVKKSGYSSLSDEEKKKLFDASQR